MERLEGENEFLRSQIGVKDGQIKELTERIRSNKLYHRQVYSFAYHRQKLALVRADSRHGRFTALTDFLEKVPSICPHNLFQDSSSASQLRNFVDRNHLIVVEKENYATRTAGLVIPTVGDTPANSSNGCWPIMASFAR